MHVLALIVYTLKTMMALVNNVMKLSNDLHVCNRKT